MFIYVPYNSRILCVSLYFYVFSLYKNAMLFAKSTSQEGEKRRRIEGANDARRAAERAAKKARRPCAGLPWLVDLGRRNGLKQGNIWVFNQEI